MCVGTFVCGIRFVFVHCFSCFWCPKKAVLRGYGIVRMSTIQVCSVWILPTIRKLSVKCIMHGKQKSCSASYRIDGPIYSTMKLKSSLSAVKCFPANTHKLIKRSFANVDINFY